MVIEIVLEERSMWHGNDIHVGLIFLHGG